MYYGFITHNFRIPTRNRFSFEEVYVSINFISGRADGYLLKSICNGTFLNKLFMRPHQVCVTFIILQSEEPKVNTTKLFYPKSISKPNSRANLVLISYGCSIIRYLHRYPMDKFFKSSPIGNFNFLHPSHHLNELNLFVNRT